MGYCHDSHGRLVCDACGSSTGVRKRTCPHRVYYAEGGSLPYCQPAALCAACYATHKATLHVACAEGAAKSNARERERKEKLANGEFEVKAAFGSWHETVPPGCVGVMFANPTLGERHMLVPEADYDLFRVVRPRYLSDYPRATPWEGPGR